MSSEAGYHPIRTQVLDATDASVIVIERDGRIVKWSNAAEFLHGWSASEAIGRNIAELLVSQECRAGVRVLLDSLEYDRFEGDFDLLRRDDSSFSGRLRITPLTNDAGEPHGAVGITIDLTERIETAREIDDGRLHMRAVTESMGEGLFVMDTDGCVTYMNSSGAMLLGWTEAELAGKDMHELTHFRHADGTPYPRDSCPIFHARKRGETVKVLDDVFIRKDGTALPVAYTSAPLLLDGNPDASVVVFHDITEQKRRDLELQAQVDSLSELRKIRAAIEGDRLVVYAQPVVCLETGMEVMHELLVRMKGEDGALVPPADFLPLAEEFGLVGELDRWMIEQAAGLAALGHRITVNLSAHSLGSPTLIGHFRSALSRAGADPSLLVAEVTETALLADEKTAREFLIELRELGCQVAIDDFGSGYGGLAYIKQFECDLLKIDREFIADLTDNRRSQKVVRAVVSLAKSFNLKTVAEGVEDADAVATLKMMGVDFVQGFLFAEPRPISMAIPSPARL
ncbi:MAG: hypothetical protein QOI31_1949 [Solirubrobacterales bacterium]|nr:hypothetical protein [Solirubrobacterales bacterium]